MFIVQSIIHDILNRIADRVRSDEAGQGTLEYVGMIAVAAVLVVAVLGVVSGADLGGFFSEQIDSVKNAVGGGE